MFKLPENTLYVLNCISKLKGFISLSSQLSVPATFKCTLTMNYSSVWVDG